jgi:hypothetical protein
MTGQGTISHNDLMHKLVNAKKVMNKVETGSFERGNVNENILRSTPEELMSNQQMMSQPMTNQSHLKPVNSNLNVDKINQSKLPDAIKKAMIENPIPQISLNDTIDMNFVQGAKKLMEREGMISKKPKSQPQQVINESYVSSDLITQLTPIIENTIRKVLDEKLNQILTAHQTSSINENLVLKVGDSIFKGKITGVNKSK